MVDLATIAYTVLLVPNFKLIKESLSAPLAPSPKYTSWQSLEVAPGVTYLTSPILNRALDTSTVTVDVCGKYEPSQNLQEAMMSVVAARRSQGQRIFDAPKPRLATDFDVLSNTVKIESTTYFAGLVSNELVGSSLVDESGQVLARGFDVCATDGVLDDLEDSRASNAIGIQTLAVTRDGFLLVTLTGAAASVGKGSWAPSGCGSMDWEDIRHGRRLRDLVVTAAERELVEECGVPEGASFTSRLIGYGRAVARGGKPEFFAVTYIDALAAEFLAPCTEKGYTDLVHPISLSDGMDGVLGALEPNLSATLRVHLALAEPYLYA